MKTLKFIKNNWMWIIILALMAFAAHPIAAQGEQITVNTKDLPPEIVAQLKQKQQVTNTLETYGEWAGMGKEIGVAMKEGLTAVKDVAVDFSKTDVGTYTMVLIAWKVVGEDVLGLSLGMIVFTVGMLFITWSYRRTVLTRKVCVQDDGWFKAKKYELVESPYAGDTGELAIVQLLHGIALVVLIAAVSAMIF